MLAMSAIFVFSKTTPATPQHIPKQPAPQLTSLQIWAKAEGVRDGSNDLKSSGKTAPLVGAPPKY